MMSFLELLPVLPVAESVAAYTYTLRIFMRIGPSILLRNIDALGQLIQALTAAPCEISRLLRRDLSELLAPLLSHSAAPRSLLPVLIRTLHNIFSSPDAKASLVVVDILDAILTAPRCIATLAVDPAASCLLLRSAVRVTVGAAHPNRTTNSPTEHACALIFRIFCCTLTTGGEELRSTLLTEERDSLTQLVHWLCRREPTDGDAPLAPNPLHRAAADAMDAIASSAEAVALCTGITMHVLRSLRPANPLYAACFLTSLLAAQSALRHFVQEMGALDFIQQELRVPAVAAQAFWGHRSQQEGHRDRGTGCVHRWAGCVHSWDGAISLGRRCRAASEGGKGRCRVRSVSGGRAMRAADPVCVM